MSECIWHWLCGESETYSFDHTLCFTVEMNSDILLVTYLIFNRLLCVQFTSPTFDEHRGPSIHEEKRDHFNAVSQATSVPAVRKVKRSPSVVVDLQNKRWKGVR